MKIRYLSHAAFILENASARVIIDPFITGNANSPVAVKDVEADYVIVTHAHSDHFGDTLEFARRGAMVISTAEIAGYCAQRGAKVRAMHIGGAHKFPFGRVKLTMAQHGSSISGPDGPVTLGSPAGVLVTMDGVTVYHTGDTGLFLDMKLIGEIHRVDVMLVPIGDNYTMDADDAIRAVEFVNPALVIPMHYNTFDEIAGVSPQDFARRLETMGRKCRVLEYGEQLEI